MRRIAWAGGVLASVLVVTALAAGWLLTSNATTPAQRLAEAAPPPDPRVLASVESRRLVEVVTLEGQARLSAQHDVLVPPVGEGRLPVVTRAAPAVGDTVEEGDVLAAVAAQPVLAVRAEVPFYRDLRSGTSGEDVAALQSFLRRIGWSVRDAAGVFGRDTERAVAGTWRNRGFDPQSLLSVEAASVAEEDRTGGPPSAEKDPSAAGQATAYTVPAQSLAVVPTLPAVVTASDASLGATVNPGDRLLTLASGDVSVAAVAAGAQATVLEVGQPASVTATGTPVPAVVTDVGVAGEDGMVPVLLAVDGGLDPASVGQGVQVAVETAGTEGPVTAVPVTAIRSAPDGRTTVAVQHDGATEDVEVTVVTVIGGWAQVAAPGGGLDIGDDVVVHG